MPHLDSLIHNEVVMKIDPRSIVASLYEMLHLAFCTSPLTFTLIVILNVFLGLLPLISAWILKSLLDLFALQHSIDSAEFQQRITALIIAFGGASLLTDIGSRLSLTLSSDLVKEISLRANKILYEEMNRVESLSQFESIGYIQRLNLASQGIHQGPSSILSKFLNIFQSTIVTISFAGAVILVDSLILPTLLFTNFISIIMNRRLTFTKFEVTKGNISKQRLVGYLGHVLSDRSYFKELRLHDSKKYFLERFVTITASINETLRKCELKAMSYYIVSAGLGSFGLILALVLSLTTNPDKAMSVGTVMFFLNGLIVVQGALSNIVTSLATIHQDSHLFSQFTELKKINVSLSTMLPLQDMQDLQIGIEFRDVYFRYDSSKNWVLSGLNLYVPAGKCTALVGENGAGKSTLVSLISRFYEPQSGRILWDGVDIRHFEVSELRRRLGYTFQDYGRFALSAKVNIGLGDISDMSNTIRIQSCARMADAHNFIEKLPLGYDSILSPSLGDNTGGVDLSGGQWQKLALARMFMKNSNFIILDEPTASLDAIAEAELCETFGLLTKGKTSLIISHRFNMTRIADIVAVMSEGKIIEYGTHDELLQSNGTYCRLFSSHINS